MSIRLKVFWRWIWKFSIAARAKADKVGSNKHNKDGYLTSIGIDEDYIKGTARLSGAQAVKTKQHGSAKDGKGGELSDDEYFADVATNEQGQIIASHAKASTLRDSFGENFSKKRSYEDGVKKDTLEKLQETLSEVEDSNPLDAAIESYKQAAKADPKNAKRYLEAANRLQSMKDSQTTPIKEAIAQTQKELEDSKGAQSYGEVLANLEKSKLDSMVGQAAGVASNLEKDPNIYMQNAQYSEMSRQQTTASKIDQQGGIDKAVAADTADARIKAQTQVDTIAARANALGFDEDKIKQALSSGGDEVASKIAKALGQLEGQNAGMKTSADIEKSDKAISMAKAASGGREFASVQDALNYLSKAQTRAQMGRGLALDDGDGVHDFVVGENGSIKEMKYDTQRKQLYGNSVNTAAMGYGVDGVAGFTGRDFIEGAAPVLGAVGAAYGFKQLAQGKLRSGTKGLLERFSGFGAGIRNRFTGNQSPQKTGHGYNNSSGDHFPHDGHNNTSYSQRNIAGQPTPTHQSNESIAKKGGKWKWLVGGGALLGGSALFGSEDQQTQEAIANTEFSDTSTALGGATLGAAALSTKTGAKVVGEGAAKSLAKKVPGLSLAAAASFAYDRFSHGDITGGFMELASGAAAMIPGVGTAASFAIDGALMARDMNASANIPQHVQNAFSTPSGYNTMAAMNADAASLNPQQLQQAAQAPVGGSIQAPGFSQPLPTIGGGSPMAETQTLIQTQTLQSNLSSQLATEAHALSTKKEIKKGQTANYTVNKQMLDAMEKLAQKNQGEDQGPGGGDGH